MDLVLQFEQSPFSVWLREGDLVPGFAIFYVLLAFHTIGMAMLVGTWWVLSFRLIGYFENVPMMIAGQAMQVCRWGFLMSLVSGIALFLSQPIRDLATSAFDVKMVLVVGALLGMATVRHWLDWVRVAAVANGAAAGAVALPGKARVVVLLTDFFWLGAIISGRLIGYLQPPPTN